MDWKIEQLERQGATDIDLLCGPFAADFLARYGSRVEVLPDDQTGIRDALRHATVRGWWTMGDVLLEQPLEGVGVSFVVPGSQVGGLWLDCGLYHRRGPWRMVETTATPWTINTPEDRRECDARIRGLSFAR
jgi:hypothetical protein